MQAIVWRGSRKVALESVADPDVESPTDALVQITSAGICGSDLHTYEGRAPAEPGMVLGHENMGVIAKIGRGVTQLRAGDRVVMPFNIACGSCLNCTRGLTSSCLTMNPDNAGAAYGDAAMGPYRGGQAEFLRVPFADFNCLKLPGHPGDLLEDDLLLLSDVFPTGYHGAVLAKVSPGDTVAVFGAGPVGLLAAYSSLIRGAAKVFVVDCIPERLAKAAAIGAVPVDFSKGDPAQQIRELRRKDPMVGGAMRIGEEKMLGTGCGIDAVGYQARDIENESHERPTQVLEQLAEVINPGGRLGILGVYPTLDPGGRGSDGKQGVWALPLGKLFEKGITIGMGQTPVKHYDFALRDLICAGRAKPSFIVSHRLALADGVAAYDKFDKRIEGYTKVVLKPNGHGAELPN
jgi:glutathione-independent formaldehyde dehydrogenase